MPDEAVDLPTIAEDFINCMITKSCEAKVGLSKDEVLTYNAALRMLKALFDRTTDVLYDEMPKEEEQFKDPFKKGDDELPPVAA